MSKRELIEAVAAGSGDSETATTGLLNAVIEIIAGVLSRGDIVQLVGLGWVRSRSTRAPRYAASTWS